MSYLSLEQRLEVLNDLVKNAKKHKNKTISYVKLGYLEIGQGFSRISAFKSFIEEMLKDLKIIKIVEMPDVENLLSYDTKLELLPRFYEYYKEQKMYSKSDKIANVKQTSSKSKSVDDGFCGSNGVEWKDISIKIYQSEENLEIWLKQTKKGIYSFADFGLVYKSTDKLKKMTCLLLEFVELEGKIRKESHKGDWKTFTKQVQLLNIHIKEMLFYKLALEPRGEAVFYDKKNKIYKTQFSISKSKS